MGHGKVESEIPERALLVNIKNVFPDFIHFLLGRNKGGWWKGPCIRHRVISCLSDVHNQGLCPDCELEQWPFSFQADTQATEPHQSCLVLNFDSVSAKLQRVRVWWCQRAGRGKANFMIQIGTCALNGVLEGCRRNTETEPTWNRLGLSSTGLTLQCSRVTLRKSHWLLRLPWLDDGSFLVPSENANLLTWLYVLLEKSLEYHDFYRTLKSFCLYRKPARFFHKTPRHTWTSANARPPGLCSHGNKNRPQVLFPLMLYRLPWGEVTLHVPSPRNWKWLWVADQLCKSGKEVLIAASMIILAVLHFWFTETSRVKVMFWAQPGLHFPEIIWEVIPGICSPGKCLWGLLASLWSAPQAGDVEMLCFWEWEKLSPF